jgi:predicted membrane protein
MPGRYLFALVLIAVGIGILGDLFGQWDFAAILSEWWPVLIIALALNALVRLPRRPWGALFWLVVGVMLLLWELALLPANLWALIVGILLIALGVYVLLPKRRKAPPAPLAPREPQWETLPPDRDTMREDVMFSGAQRRFTSPHFRGGTANVAFGGATFDLRQAELVPEGATLELAVTFGGIELRVPDHWTVFSSGDMVLGSCENRTRPAADIAGKPVLHVICSGAFGGIEIHN